MRLVQDTLGGPVLSNQLDNGIALLIRQGRMETGRWPADDTLGGKDFARERSQ